MLYAILNPSVEEVEGENDDDVDDVELPAEVRRIMRASLSLELDDVRELQDRLQQNVAGEAKKQKETQTKEAAAAAATQMSRERAEALRKKVQSVGRLMRVFKTLRQQNELVVQLKGCTPGHRIPVGLLLQGKEGLQNELQKFESAKKIDAMNERRPDGQEERPSRSASLHSLATSKQL
eukprot:GHVS01003180.1.p1 GENE.GHVS01003180.1~~GHVS01003180.1.p1  ORF type:complete len:179 (+),score=33.31 GHVS01003180.1:3-539(+)